MCGGTAGPGRRAARGHRAARGGGGRPVDARGAHREGADPAAQRGRRRVLPRRRAAPPADARPPAPGTRREAAARRGGARRDRHPPAARQAGLHDAERLRARGLRAARGRRPRPPRGARAPALLRVQAEVLERAPLLRPAVPAVRRASTSRKRTETADLSRPRRAAHRRSGEDRLPGRHQAAARRRRRSSSRRGSPADSALRYAGSPTSTSGATGSRSSASTCATRRASRRSAATSRATRPRLDFIVNNACQTVRRPPEFYRHMMELETASLGRHARAGPGAARASTRACAATAHARPTAGAARHGGAGGSTRRADPRRPSSRRRRCCPTTTRARRATSSPRAGSTRTCSRSTSAAGTRGASRWPRSPSVELLETQLVNAVAPFVLNARLKPLMLRTPSGTSTSSTCRRSRASSTGGSRPRSTRTRTWPRPR